VISATGPDAEGTLHADVYLRGAGDSLLSLDDLDSLAKAVAAKGVKRITGGVVGDGSIFEDGPYGTNWGWDTLNDDYAPAITGLDINDGVVKIQITPGAAVGEPVAYKVEPFTNAQAVVDEASTGAKGTTDTIRARHPWRQDVIVLSGILPADGKRSIEIPVADPVAFAADLFRLALLKDGVSVEGAASTGRTPMAATVTLAVHKSPAMGDYIASMNKPSDNLLAESLIRVIGVEKASHGDYDTGDAAEIAFLKSLGIDTRPLALDDGSGVSRRDYVTARSIVDLLAAEGKQPYFSKFRDSLPVAGVDGTLRHRLIGTVAQGNVRAKTGTLTAASALSGYFSGASGKQYAFSLLMNNYPGTASEVRSIQDKLLVELVRDL
jgi:D-alanyl-D-alanine carboxypeptidase/D-alanyl-D-alanine-endopeptidase (penicillin-binding protein 4)